MGFPMITNVIKNLDSTLTIISEKDSSFNYLGITDSYQKASHHLFFVKNKNYLQEALAFNNLHEIGLVFEEKYFLTLDETTINDIKNKTLLVATSKDVMATMCLTSEIFYHDIFSKEDNVLDGRQLGTTEIDPTVFIAQGVFIGSNVKIKANTKIHSGVVIHSNVTIGENVEIYPNVTIYSKTQIGNNVRIHAGTVIGADGFGYHFYKGQHLKIWHMGGVEIHDAVEIGANSCVDMGTFSPTIIGKGSKIDNHVQVGHNCKLGMGVILCGQAAVGGSTTIGDFTVVGGQAGFANGLKIGSQVQVAGGAGVISNLKDKETVGGFPARDMKEWLRSLATLRKLSLEKKGE